MQQKFWHVAMVTVSLLLSLLAPLQRTVYAQENGQDGPSPQLFLPLIQMSGQAAANIDGAGFELTRDAKDTDLILQEVARRLAIAATDETVRSFVHEEAQKLFDGDAEFLYAPVADTPLTERGGTLADALLKAGGEEGADLLRAAAGMPNLQIYVWEMGKWDSRTFTPIVAVKPEDDATEGTAKFAIKAYDSRGGVVWLSPTEKPAETVLVVGISERVDEQGKPYKDRQSIELRPQTSMSGEIAAAAVQAPNTGPRRVCIRPYESVDHLNWFRLKNTVWARWEWFEGAPEVTLKIVGEQGLQVFETTWEYPWGLLPFMATFISYPAHQDLYHWYPDQYGGFMSYFFSEEDSRRKQIDWEITGSAGIKVPGNTLTNTNVTLKVKISQKDEKLGQMLINCRDAIPPLLSTSDIEFNLDNFGGGMPAVNSTLPVSANCGASITLDGSQSVGENRYFVEIYPTSGVGQSDVIGQYFSQWTIDDRPIPIDLSSIYPFKTLAGASTVYRVKLAVSNHPVAGTWNETVKWVTVNSTATAAFTVNSPVAAGQPVIMDGSASTGETNYFLEVFQTAGYGSSTVTGFYKSQWFSGQAPSNIPLHSFYGGFTPGWYKVKLAVQNNCTNWVEVSNWIEVTP